MNIIELDSRQIDEIAGGPLPLVVVAFWAGVKAGAAAATVSGAVQAGVAVGVAGATAALAAEIID
ncbi:hypothetical protein C0V72_05730 [Porphyrobacter sp. TH134]|uniref:hypothetical protein n=1 Tax=Porphyrobacter sp. TH134 TaxID=2067450 RepID=UPI000C7A582D|nr:hypothetical protein [Porphyrobacter sp. TH134]PLK24575.1 hypothetical protein C0V72_05730 [Porphyrobacter sp. TH134]